MTGMVLPDFRSTISREKSACPRAVGGREHRRADRARLRRLGPSRFSRVDRQAALGMGRAYAPGQRARALRARSTHAHLEQFAPAATGLRRARRSGRPAHASIVGRGGVGGGDGRHPMRHFHASLSTLCEELQAPTGHPETAWQSGLEVKLATDTRPGTKPRPRSRKQRS
jgi:hypothetical protein